MTSRSSNTPATPVSNPASAKGVETITVPAEDSLVLVRRDMLASACAAIRLKKDAPTTLEYLRARAFSASPAPSRDAAVPASGGVDWLVERLLSWPCTGDDRDGKSEAYINDLMRQAARRLSASPAPTSGSGDVGGPTYIVNCCNCGRIIDTREADEGGDGFGAELSDNRWTCSPECWDAVVEPDALAKPASEPAGGEVREALARAREIAGLLTERAIKLSVNGRVPNADADLMRRAGAWMRGMADIFEASLSAPATPSPAEEAQP